MNGDLSSVLTCMVGDQPVSVNSVSHKDVMVSHALLDLTNSWDQYVHVSLVFLAISYLRAPDNNIASHVWRK